MALEPPNDEESLVVDCDGCGVSHRHIYLEDGHCRDCRNGRPAGQNARERA